MNFGRKKRTITQSYASLKFPIRRDHICHPNILNLILGQPLQKSCPVWFIFIGQITDHKSQRLKFILKIQHGGPVKGQLLFMKFHLPPIPKMDLYSPKSKPRSYCFDGSCSTRTPPSNPEALYESKEAIGFRKEALFSLLGC
jgi:hypothetical protein